MQPSLKYRLTTGWNFMRIVRLGLAVAIIVNGVIGPDGLILAAGGFLLTQAALNVGCCASGNCAVEINKPKDKNEIAFEKITKQS